MNEHTMQRQGDRFICKICIVRWPCLAKKLAILERMEATRK